MIWLPLKSLQFIKNKQKNKKHAKHCSTIFKINRLKRLKNKLVEYVAMGVTKGKELD